MYSVRNIFFIVTCCISGMLLPGALQAQEPIGSIQSDIQKEGNIIRFSTTHAAVRLKFCTPSMVRVQASWDETFKKNEQWMVIKYDWKPVTIHTSTHEGYYQFETDQLLVKVWKDPLLIEFYNEEGKLLSTEKLADQTGGVKKNGRSVAVQKKLFPGEHFFGFGERMDFIDRRGKKVKLNVGRGDAPSHLMGAYNIMEANYSPVPFFMSTRGYGIFFHTPYATQWDMGHSNPGSYSFSAADGEVDYYFIYGPGFPAILNKYTTLTGKSPMLPKVAYGLNVGTYSGGTWGHEKHASPEYVVNLGRKFKQTGIPADILHLDSTWRIFGKNGHGATTFEWREAFENPEAMFDSLYAMGYNMAGVHIRPRYDNGEKYNLLDRARETGVVYPENDGRDGLVNFFDQEAVEWWWENGVMKVASQGAMFFKTDEGSAFDFKPEGIPERRHNLFPIAYAKATYEQFSKYNDMRGFNLTREGYAGIQRYPYIWAGDWPSEWQYFKPVIRAGLNMGLSGVGHWSHNMGGFEHKADSELYIRWCQFGLFSPVAHLFGMDHPGYKEPWNYGEEAQRIFKKYDRMRYRLIPYIYSEAWKMHKTGMPMMQALVLNYQNDENVYPIDDQYLFGSELLIAPVTTKGARSIVVYLPEGTWIDYWSGKKYSGRQYYNITTPLEELPIFVKAGAIIPWRDNIEALGEQSADTLTLEIFPQGNSSYEIYSDDGSSKDYLQGEYAITNIKVKDSRQQTTIHIQAPKGEYEVPKRSYQLLVHIQELPSVVQEGSEVLNQYDSRSEFQQQANETGWYFDEGAGELHVRLAGNSKADISATIIK